ncbi:hypothetical protein WA1_19355 [Scytonema hofmannii PCC 7110]|uniref:Uncharacterized protein n=1 Tax=Scytonema hofmannii PCC 7110 TaxID=128403 RepID=A0A139XC05_9CYAN|nr:hypothetical protein [Scytonema hofmannii]KYC42152.1 hypothetical protein WA1_19355 [Scytonema hofmannii PCC 7110]
MICLKSFDGSDEFDALELEALDEIFSKYKYALTYIGVDFSQQDVQEALLNCVDGFEDALRATIAYWYWLEENSKPFYPNPCIIQAIREQWDSRYWKDEYLNNPNFKSPCELFWESAKKNWGADVRNEIIADVNSDETGFEYILFRNGKTMSLSTAQRLGSEKLKEYALQPF